MQDLPCGGQDPGLGGAIRWSIGISRLQSGGVRRRTQLISDGQPLPALGSAKAGCLLTCRSPLAGIDAVKQRYRNRIDDLHFDHGLTGLLGRFVMKHRTWPNIWLHVLAVF